MDYTTFFQKVVPAALLNLQPQSAPAWGSMNALEVLHHLTTGFELSLNSAHINILVPEAHWPAAKKFLMGPKPMPKGFEKPSSYNLFPMPANMGFTDLKSHFLTTLQQMLTATETADFSSKHPQFGILNGTETKHLHVKHITHHFIQFGLMSEAQ